VLDDARVAIEVDASATFSGASDLLPLRSGGLSSDEGESHVAEGHGARRELRAISDAVGFQSGIDAGEDSASGGTRERRAVATNTRVDGEVAA